MENKYVRRVPVTISAGEIATDLPLGDVILSVNASRSDVVRAMCDLLEDAAGELRRMNDEREED